MFGAKTLVTLVFVALAAALTGTQGLLDPDYLSRLSPEACLVIGIFAAVGGTIVVGFWKMGQPSSGYIGLRSDFVRFDEIRLVGKLAMGKRPDAKVKDMPGSLRAGGIGFVFLCVGLVAFGNRAVGLLTDIPERMANLSMSEYCAPVDPAAKPKVTKKVVAAPGCALVLRAFRLGYTKKLGNCAPKEVTQTEAAKKREICRDRLAGEPLFHYAWRLVSEKASALGEVSPSGAIRGGIKQIETKLGYVSSLLASQSHAIRASPRSSHHIWTNLPNPNPTGLIERWLVPQNCSSRFAKLDINVRWSDGKTATSKVLDHAVGQLMFNPRFGTPPGYCREYTIHWGSSVDACDRLKAKPTGFLGSSDALDSVRAVIDRRKHILELRQLTTDLGDKHHSPPPPELDRVISFNCFMVDDAGTSKVTHGTVSIDGARISVRDLRAKASAAVGAGQLETYQHIAMLLTGGTRYAGPVTEDPIARVSGEPPGPDEMSGDDFPLTKLEILRSADPFLGAAWPLERDDLLEVYPFHVHLRNFTNVFRRSYRTQRGRL